MTEAHQPISVVVPVLDDREGMRELIAALSAQRRVPDECVVVDGGSTDGTVDVLEASSAPFPIRIVRRPGRNIAAARNAGISAASSEWIACTDAGCLPARGWLAALEAERARADFAAGVVDVEGDTTFERLLALTHYPSAEELDTPSPWIRLSHRVFGRGYVQDRSGGGNIAFSKSVWRDVGGFPEKVYAGEDRAFTSAVMRAGFRMSRSRDAVVRWRPPGTWRGGARMFYTYSRGDVRVPGRARHGVRLAAWLVAARSVRAGWRLRLAVGAAGLAYIALPVHRARRGGLPVRDWWRIPLLIALKDLSQLAGATRGLLDAAQGTPQPPPPRRRG
jgi:cellulose synthase/poly-beta-1,6-N-acetylglucosamine synthase-like glycosyltransferase